MVTNNSKVIEYIAYLILVRSMLRNSNLKALSPSEERILNYLAIDLFIDKKISVDDAKTLVPGLDKRVITMNLKNLFDKGYLKLKHDTINNIELTELSKQYLSNMGRCLFHATSEMLEYE